MHISLDSALGRQRRLNSVGESVFQIAPNAAAGYSLRSLTGGDPAVVRVRRESDNAERDFNASGVSSGELVNWVNQQITPPLDLRELTATGRDGPIIDAAAAYSLRNLSDSYTGNVVDVRRSSDDATRSFTAAEVADGTLTDWVNVGKNYVGYARFQDSTTANVSLTSSFTLEATNNWSIKFGYIGGSTPAGLFGSSGNSNTGFWFGTLSTVGITDDSGFFSALSFGGGLALKIGQHHEIEFFNTPAEGVRVKVDGVTMSGLPKIYGDITLNKVGISRGRDGERVIENVRIDLNGDGTLDYSYAGDGNQASNWTDRVGSNNGTPTAQVLTYNNEFTSGFVSQWYDQSTTAGTPNANHAVQTDAASQPKIVDAGSLVTGGLDFDGTDDHLDLSGSGLDIFNDVGYGQVFTAITPDRTSTGSLRYFEAGSGATGARFILGDSQDYASSSRVGGRRLDSDSFQDVESSTSHGNNETLITAFLNWTDSDAYLYFNGTQVASSTSFQTDGNTSNTSSASAAIGGNTLQGNFKMQELIIYNTDQTDNRTALEANIGEVYSIAGIPAYDDTVNGFVETWYDQSGNDNDAVQLTASNQPKIVDAGVLVAGGIDFDGVDDFFEANGVASSLSGTDKPLSSFMVVSSDVAATTQFILSCGLSSSSSPIKNTLFHSGNTTGFQVRDNAGILNADLAAAPYSPLATYLISNTSDGLVVDYAQDGSVTVNNFDVDVGPLTIDTVKIGARANASSGPLDGKIAEMVIYPSDQSANRAAIEANIILQYDI